MVSVTIALHAMLISTFLVSLGEFLAGGGGHYLWPFRGDVRAFGFPSVLVAIHMVDVDVKWESVLDVVNGKDYFCLCLYHLAWVVDCVGFFAPLFHLHHRYEFPCRREIPPGNSFRHRQRATPSKLNTSLTRKWSCTSSA